MFAAKKTKDSVITFRLNSTLEMAYRDGTCPGTPWDCQSGLPINWGGQLIGIYGSPISRVWGVWKEG